MAAEEQLENARIEITSKINLALAKKGMKKSELADLLNVPQQRLSLAINGGTTPRDIKLRKKIYVVLGME